MVGLCPKWLLLQYYFATLNLTSSSSSVKDVTLLVLSCFVNPEQKARVTDKVELRVDGRYDSLVDACDTSLHAHRDRRETSTH